MSDRKTAEPSPESTSRANRQRLAREDGTRAMAELEGQADKVRKNMQRLRALREASEAEGLGASTVLAQPAKKKRKKPVVK
jgi:hypothetical protein